jgi:hypothetical protein
MLQLPLLGFSGDIAMLWGFKVVFMTFAVDEELKSVQTRLLVVEGTPKYNLKTKYLLRKLVPSSF